MRKKIKQLAFFVFSYYLLISIRQLSKVKKQERLRGSIEFRAPFSMIKKVEEYVDANRFSNESEAYRSLMQRGMEVEDLLIIKNDPEKNAEFETKMKSIFKLGEIEKIVKNCSEEEIKAVKFILENDLNHRAKQLLLKITES